MDLLYDAARAWQRLLNYKYDITCGKSKKLHKITLDFRADEFYHLAGFPHMEDIVFDIQGSRAKMLTHILEHAITEADISKSEGFEKFVKGKLTAIIHLEHLLNRCPQAFMFNPSKLPKHTYIKAKYLLVDNDARVIFLFTDRDENGQRNFSRSTFVMDNIDFRTNQSPITVLQIKKTNLATGHTDILFRCEGFTE